jgi:hypothetical protein
MIGMKLGSVGDVAAAARRTADLLQAGRAW